MSWSYLKGSRVVWEISKHIILCRHNVGDVNLQMDLLSTGLPQHTLFVNFILFYLLYFCHSLLFESVYPFCFAMSSALSSSINHIGGYDTRFASIAKGDPQPRLYGNLWTDNQHYVCQYNCEYSR